MLIHDLPPSRYILLFKTGIRAQKTKDTEDFRDMYRQQSDVCMLRLFESFLESAPQLVLQLYIMMSHHDYSAWTGEFCLLIFLIRSCELYKL